MDRRYLVVIEYNNSRKNQFVIWSEDPDKAIKIALKWWENPSIYKSLYAINTNLSLKGCWKMVNAIQNGNTPEEIRRRCNVAEEWLKANTVISNEDYDDLMKAVAFLYNESYER